MVLEYLDKYEVSPNSVKFVEIPFHRMEDVLTLKEVDAICAIEPFVTFAMQKENKKIIAYNYVELYDKIEIASYCVSQNWLKNNEELAQKFYRAIQKATLFCGEHENELKDIISKYTSLNSKQIKDVVLPTFGDKLNQKELQHVINRVYDRGWIKNDLNAEQLIFSMDNNDNISVTKSK
jgi:NitT/TauT family transport system substrate-binding protein